jgi:hypothetical protein
MNSLDIHLLYSIGLFQSLLEDFFIKNKNNQSVFYRVTQKAEGIIP